MSQFDALFKKDAPAKPKTAEKTKPTRKKTAATPPLPKATASSAPLTSLPVAKTAKRIPGKSSNSDYTQVLSYVRRDTHNAVKAALIFDKQKRDLSDLIEELLAGWIKKQQ